MTDESVPIYYGVTAGGRQYFTDNRKLVPDARTMKTVKVRKQHLDRFIEHTINTRKPDQKWFLAIGTRVVTN